jgi:hypothetical protein
MAMITPETIARKVKALYETYYQTALDETAAAWAATEVISTPFFEHIVISADPASQAVAQLHPSLAISFGPLNESLDDTLALQQFLSYYTFELQLFYFVRGIDEEYLGKVILRHMESTLRMLQDHPRLDCGRDVTTHNFRLEPSANIYRSGGNMLVKGLRVRIDVRFVQRGG